MSEIYKIEYLNGITRIKFLKKPTYKDTTTAIDDIVENYPYERRMWILSDFNFSEQEIQDISKYGKSKFTKPNKIALVAAGNLAYGEMRQFMVYREEEKQAEACFFRTEEEAINWLNQI